MLALFVRVIASWLGISPYSAWMRPVMILTDWLIEPIRRILPPMGMIDFSRWWRGCSCGWPAAS